MRLIIGDRNHLTENLAIKLDSKSYEILNSLGFTNIGDLVGWIEKRNEEVAN